MKRDEIDALRKAADEIWEIARKLEKLGFTESSEHIRGLSSTAHDLARLASLKLKR